MPEKKRDQLGDSYKCEGTWRMSRRNGVSRELWYEVARRSKVRRLRNILQSCDFVSVPRSRRSKSHVTDRITPHPIPEKPNDPASLLLEPVSTRIEHRVQHRNIKQIQSRPLEQKPAR